MAGLTELEAINYMLLSAGEQPVTALAGEGLGTDTTTARFLLDLVRKEVQERGLDENVYELIIPLNTADNTVSLPNNTIDAYVKDSLEHTDTSGETRGNANFIVRDGKLYNASKQSFDLSEFNDEVEDQGGFRVCVKVYLDFEDLNPTSRRAVMEEAARRYQLATQGDQQVDRMMAQRAEMSRVIHRANDFNNKGRNLFDGSDYRRWFAVSRQFPYYYGRNSIDATRKGY